MRKKNEKKFKEIDETFKERKIEFDEFVTDTQDKHADLKESHNALRVEYDHTLEQTTEHFEKSDAVLYRLKSLVDPSGAEYETEMSEDEDAHLG